MTPHGLPSMLKGHPMIGAGPLPSGSAPQRDWPLWSVHVALAVVMVNNGVYHVLAKVALAAGVHQLVFCVYRDAIALLALLPAALTGERSLHHLMSPKLLLPFFLLGLTGILGNQLLFLVGLNLTGPATAAALQPSIPVFTLLLALLLGLDSLKLRQRGDQLRLVGLALCVGGAVLMAVFRGPLLLGAGDGACVAPLPSAGDGDGDGVRGGRGAHAAHRPARLAALLDRHWLAAGRRCLCRPGDVSPELRSDDGGQQSSGPRHGGAVQPAAARGQRHPRLPLPRGAHLPRQCHRWRPSPVRSVPSGWRSQGPGA
ncbi:hypothetical protein CLOM_g7788 [Closterium sp. NIES-68]|nr:hypothetical protein CLOM_g7788 [Closterium sp. NIES-68]GJP70352.1 hypothetical protein CLOP_g1294 [Closterium sp. NIES-67]